MEANQATPGRPEAYPRTGRREDNNPVAPKRGSGSDVGSRPRLTAKRSRPLSVTFIDEGDKSPTTPESDLNPPSPSPVSDSDATSENAPTVQHEPFTYIWKNLNVWADPPRPSIWSMIRKYFKSERKEHHHHHRHSRHRGRHKHQTEEEDEASRKTINSDRLMLLNNASGICTSGQLTGIIGGSGSGKSLLLNTLSFRGCDELHVAGDRVLNGEPADYESVLPLLAYVQQADMFIGALTVREHLTFQSRLRMSPLIPNKTQAERVEEVIHQFGLKKCADTVIGITGIVKGISGGEQKRLAFATEILTDPPMFFCDEPTSGLDSFMAFTIVATLKDLAIRQNKGVMLTIHQPSTDCFNLFDDLIVLSEGRIAFAGPREHALEFMASTGYPSPRFFNPAEFLTLTLTPHPEEEEESRERIDTVCSAFEESPDYKELMDRIESTVPDNSSSRSSSSDASTLVLPCVGPSQYKSSWLRQFRILTHRSFLTMVKDPVALRFKIAQSIAISLMLGATFYNQQLDQDGVTGISGFLFMSVASLGFTNGLGAVNTFCGELPLAIREHSNAMYSSSSYYLSKVVSEVPLFSIVAAVCSIISFYLTGLDEISFDETESLCYFALLTFICCVVSMLYGYFVSCMCSNLKVALMLGPTLLIPYILLGGKYLVGDSKVKLFNWIRYASWMQYIYHNMALTIWDGVTGVECNRINVTCLPDGTITGHMVLVQIAAADDSFSDNMWIVGAQTTFYFVTAYVFLFWHMRKRA